MRLRSCDRGCLTVFYRNEPFASEGKRGIVKAVDDAGRVAGAQIAENRTQAAVRNGGPEPFLVPVPAQSVSSIACGVSRRWIVGSWGAPSASDLHGFAYDTVHDFMCNLDDVLGSRRSEAVSVNRAGVCVGWMIPFDAPAGTRATAFRLDLNTLEQDVIGVPGAVESRAWKINDLGVIVGEHDDGGGVSRPFVQAGRSAPRALGRQTGKAVDVDARGRVLVRAISGSSFLWEDGEPERFTPLEGLTPVAMSEGGRAILGQDRDGVEVLAERNVVTGQYEFQSLFGLHNVDRWAVYGVDISSDGDHIVGDGGIQGRGGTRAHFDR